MATCPHLCSTRDAHPLGFTGLSALTAPVRVFHGLHIAEANEQPMDLFQYPLYRPLLRLLWTLSFWPTECNTLFNRARDFLPSPLSTPSQSSYPECWHAHNPLLGLSVPCSLLRQWTQLVLWTYRLSYLCLSSWPPLWALVSCYYSMTHVQFGI